LAKPTHNDSVGWYARFDFIIDEIVDLLYGREKPRFVFWTVWDIKGVEIKPVFGDGTSAEREIRNLNGRTTKADQSCIL
jgi:hypothetical protein